ncbi:nuclease SbcCD subunit D [Capnocytophaga sp. HP1101]
MNFLHTADWHLGQTFYQYDRYKEHQFFLDNLLQIIEEQHTDVLLISGDVFDTANPSVASVKQFYHFLHQATERFEQLQIIAIAGNHDSPVRLEMPQPLLEDTQVHLVGYVKRNEQREIDYDRLIIPLYEKGEVTAYCLAVPFLRLGDTPKAEGTLSDYTNGISTFYREITEKALAIAKGKPLIAMGHLHVSGVTLNDEDTAERPIIGGMEGVKPTSFPDTLQYIALGHIHKAQALGGKEHIRYSGSPIPLSFSEKHYLHQVVVFSLEENNVQQIKTVPLPLHTPLLSIPEQPLPIEEVLNALSALPKGNADSPAPYLGVKVLLNEPAPELKNSILKAIAHKHVRLARIDVRYKQQQHNTKEPLQKEITLNNLQPYEVLQRVYKNKFQKEIPEFYKTLFDEAMEKVND